MIGYIRISDIPQFAITIVIAIFLLLGLGSLIEFLNPKGIASDTLFIGGVVFTAIFSYWAGRRIWNWIDDRFLD
jgi:hypothetical protein